MAQGRGERVVLLLKEQKFEHCVEQLVTSYCGYFPLSVRDGVTLAAGSSEMLHSVLLELQEACIHLYEREHSYIHGTESLLRMLADEIRALSSMVERDLFSAVQGRC